MVAQTLLKKVGGQGRVAAFEILVGTNAVRNLIRENQIPQMYSMIQTGSRYGMVTLEDSVHSLLQQGIIDEEEARIVLAKSTDEDGAERDPVVSAVESNPKLRKQSGADVMSTDDQNKDSGYSF